jgi:hypothetical protein
MNRAQSVVYDVDAVPVTLFRLPFVRADLLATGRGHWAVALLAAYLGFHVFVRPRFPRLRFVTGIPIPMAVRCTFLCVP